MSESSPSGFVGVCAYRVNLDGTLDGVWSVSGWGPDRGLGREHLSGGLPGVLEGTYACETYDDSNRLILQAMTTISANGAAYALTWSGNDGSSYAGIAILDGENTLAASYWPSAPA